ncbi:unnamed protein product, partial [Staurois parvus]
MQAGHKTKHTKQYDSVTRTHLSKKRRFLTKMKFLKNFKFPAVPVPVRPDFTGTGTQKPDAGIGQRRWPGTLQGT